MNVNLHLIKLRSFQMCSQILHETTVSKVIKVNWYQFIIKTSNMCKRLLNVLGFTLNDGWHVFSPSNFKSQLSCKSIFFADNNDIYCVIASSLLIFKLITKVRRNFDLSNNEF